MCMDCGNKFRDAKELIEEKSKISTWCFIGGPAIIILGIIAGLSWISIALGIFVIIGGFIDKKESEEIQNKKYEAEYYKKKKE